MLSRPMIASQGLTVPPGTSAQSRPLSRATVRLPVFHQGAVVLSNVPLEICSGPAACAAVGVNPAAIRQAAANIAAKRLGFVRFKVHLVGGDGSSGGGSAPITVSPLMFPTRFPGVNEVGAA